MTDQPNMVVLNSSEHTPVPKRRSQRYRRLMYPMAVIVAFVAGLGLGFTRKTPVHEPEPVPATPTYNTFRWKPYRSHPSYIGDVIDLAGRSFGVTQNGYWYAPSSAGSLIRTGNNEWFITADMPLFRNPKDAALSPGSPEAAYPFKLRLILTAPTSAYSQYALELTLPDRSDFSFDTEDNQWHKALSPERINMISSPQYVMSYVPLLPPIPGPGLRLNDYFTEQLTASQLKQDQTGFVAMHSITRIGKTNQAYLCDCKVLPTLPRNSKIGWAAVKMTSHGIIAYLGKPQPPHFVPITAPLGYQPQQADLRITVVDNNMP